MKKIRPNHILTFVLFLILFVLISFVLWGMFGTRWWALDGKPYVNNGMINDIIVFSISFVLCLTGFIIYVVKTTYYVDKYEIKIPGRKKDYFFKDITYLDEEYSNKHMDAKIYVEGEGVVNLTLDRKKELLKIIKERSNLMDENKFRFKHPGINI